ncbi:MAG: hypothetical protein P0S96_07270 [Simkaniaceae bacterium]|nr:hypothetical protein [Candidatus Sacchlamyda saccharinae]
MRISITLAFSTGGGAAAAAAEAAGVAALTTAARGAKSLRDLGGRDGEAKRDKQTLVTKATVPNPTAKPVQYNVEGF